MIVVPLSGCFFFYSHQLDVCLDQAAVAKALSAASTEENVFRQRTLCYNITVCLMPESS